VIVSGKLIKPPAVGERRSADSQEFVVGRGHAADAQADHAQGLHHRAAYGVRGSGMGRRMGHAVAAVFVVGAQHTHGNHGVLLSMGRVQAACPYLNAFHSIYPMNYLKSVD
jgi:hypothetical protein